MTQTHHFSRKLATRSAKPSTVVWAIGVPDTLVIFVHGFKGSAAGTWPQFPELLPRTAEAAQVDFVFYQYDGVRAQSNNSALDLFQFLDEFLKKPLDPVVATLGAHPRPADFAYGRVIIVAHSLGGVVTRRALLNAHRAATTDRATRAWLALVRMLLFAPAHRGANAAVLAGQVVDDMPWYLAKLVGRGVQYQSPLISELTPGSLILNDLERDTVKALATDPGAYHLVARQVVWAGKEKIVINADFGSDPLAIPMNDRDHFSVCKPRHLTDQTLLTLLQEITAP